MNWDNVVQNAEARINMMKNKEYFGTKKRILFFHLLETVDTPISPATPHTMFQSSVKKEWNVMSFILLK